MRTSFGVALSFVSKSSVTRGGAPEPWSRAPLLLVGVAAVVFTVAVAVRSCVWPRSLNISFASRCCEGVASKGRYFGARRFASITFDDRPGTPRGFVELLASRHTV